MSTFTLLSIGGSHFVCRKAEDAAKVLTILSAAQPVEEHYDSHSETPHRVSVRPAEYGFTHRVTVETRPASQLQAPEPKRIPKSHRLTGGAS